jgi:hypothetical protein
MTDNTKFKEEGAQLLEMLTSFRRKYIHHYPVHACPAKAFEGMLRAMLMVGRTDEENQQQIKKDARIWRKSGSNPGFLLTIPDENH